jgi:hypothetical protein
VARVGRFNHSYCGYRAQLLGGRAGFPNQLLPGHRGQEPLQATAAATASSSGYRPAANAEAGS